MQQTLLDATETLAHMIVAARADLMLGRSVDLTRLEAVAAGIYKLAAQNPDAARQVNAALVDRLTVLMTGLADLEADIEREHAAARTTATAGA